MPCASAAAHELEHVRVPWAIGAAVRHPSVNSARRSSASGGTSRGRDFGAGDRPRPPPGPARSGCCACAARNFSAHAWISSSSRTRGSGVDRSRLPPAGRWRKRYARAPVRRARWCRPRTRRRRLGDGMRGKHAGGRDDGDGAKLHRITPFMRIHDPPPASVPVRTPRMPLGEPWRPRSSSSRRAGSTDDNAPRRHSSSRPRSRSGATSAASRSSVRAASGAAISDRYRRAKAFHVAGVASLPAEVDGGRAG